MKINRERKQFNLAEIIPNAIADSKKYFKKNIQIIP
jgi:hypothetical protein